MHGIVSTNLGTKQRSCQGPGRFILHFSFLLGLKSMEEKELSISGTNEASGPWRVDLVVQYYKIYLRKKTAQASQQYPKPQLVQSQPLHVSVKTGKGERMIAGHWCQFMMEQHKIFPALWMCTYIYSPLPSALLCCKEAAESDWQLGTKCSVRPVMGSSAVKSVFHLGPTFTQEKGKTRKFYLTL